MTMRERQTDRQRMSFPKDRKVEEEGNGEHCGKKVTPIGWRTFDD